MMLFLMYWYIYFQSLKSRLMNEKYPKGSKLVIKNQRDYFGNILHANDFLNETFCNFF
jgi:hypothetical protein